MRAREFTSNSETKEQFMNMFSKFLPLAMEVIELKSLPKMIFMTDVDITDQPTFGQYINDEHTLSVALANRHPVDILRTVAHELVHYKQDTEHQLNVDSGQTGSPEENQANQVAGVVMRHFNKRYPEFLKSKPIIA
jgi:Zn-dependent peptidase ImmA (M78 family)